ncbi:MAG: KUP/HAK/KT family potassium transporter [Nitriliruptor sp.]|uniref:potassium transporter Kup n=1 Tax=Nitriliruptor sp. TaxID=2448056 RepID=UPI0034A07902
MSRPPAPDRGHLALLSLGALGVVYGDIGTSPLYAFREAIHATGGRAADTAGILGILSMVFWALMLVVSLKYLAVVMRADNHGEGGILALTALVLPSGGPATGRRRLLVWLGLFGTALLYGDGIITPSISVLAAVEGLQLAAPALGGWVVPIAVAGVAFLALGGVFLVVTGAEALYADLGHFGRRPIQLGWVTIVLPALVLNYLGQGALLLADPEAASNPFFLMAPGWALLPLVALATAATVIASQALISGAYSITMQAIQLGYLPRVRIDHTSSREFGQVYLPAVNVALMVACIGLVLAFRSSTALAAAYGIAVTSTMIITTVLLLVVARERWRWSLPAVVGVGAAFLALDIAFLGANVVKIPAGGWLPLLVGAVIFTVMTTWRGGRRHTAARRRLGARDLADLVAAAEATPRTDGTAIYLGAEPGHVPTALESNLTTHGVLHRHVVVVTVQVADLARVAADQRAQIHDLGAGCTQVLLTFGFMEQPDVPRTLDRALRADRGIDLPQAVYVLGRETIVANPDIPGMRPWRERLFTLLHRNAASAVRYF